MNALEILRWILASISLAVFLLMAFSNTASIIRGSSSVPVVGAILGSLGVILLPLEGSWKFFWVPFVFDPGTLLFVFGNVIMLIRGRGDEGQ